MPSLFLCTVFLLDEVFSRCGSVFADLALYLAVGRLASVELSCSLSFSCFKHVRHRFFPCCLDLFLFLSSSSVVGSRSATSYLATALLSARGQHHLATELQPARGRASACSGPCCESSSGSSVPILALVGSLQSSARP